ncbi:MAG: response regulator transcription factor [Lachnospiraceae bacterium]|nr:response regulator transcription factor [Lachnospiraceae bacterium]
MFSMLCAGLSMDEICRNLKISYDGLKKHNRNIYRKLGVKGRAEAERKAAQLRLVHRGGYRIRWRCLRVKNKFFTLVFASQMDKQACLFDPWRANYEVETGCKNRKK